MAFTRQYAAQGDPFRMRTMRAGKLGHVRTPLHMLRPGSRASLARMRRLTGVAGDPFKFRLPKFVRKLTVGKIAKFALPLVATAIGGPIGGLAAGLLGGGGGGGREEPSVEQFEPPMIGTPGEVATDSRDYEPEYEEPEDEEPDYEDESLTFEDQEY